MMKKLINLKYKDKMPAAAAADVQVVKMLLAQKTELESQVQILV